VQIDGSESGSVFIYDSTSNGAPLVTTGAAELELDDFEHSSLFQTKLLPLVREINEREKANRVLKPSEKIISLAD
jgi:hypothetical protein